MIRKVMTRARKGLTAMALGATLAFAPAPAHAFWDTKKAWNDLLQLAVKQVNAPGEFEIILGEVTKPEDGFALISTLQIKDSDGIWFDASNLLVDWSPTALLRGRFTFDTLSAEQITILRAPIGRGDPPAEEAPPVALAWPRPPVPISIDVLKIDRLRIEGGLLPQDLEATVEGAFRDIGDVQDAKLTIQRTDRPGDRITLISKIDFDDLDIAFDLKATEEPGGLVAQMGSLPPDQALELDLSAKGTPENLPFELFADIGQIGVAKGKGVASWDGLITARFNGTVEPGEETSADWKRAIGEAAKIDVDFEETEKGTYSLKSLDIDSDAFELSGEGIVDTGGNAIDIAIDWEAKDVASFNQIIAPASVTELVGTAQATGKLTAPKLDVDATVGGLDAAFGKAETIRLKIDSRPIDGEIGEVGKQQGFDFEASAKGLELTDASIQDALGANPSFSGKGQFDGIASVIALDTLKVDAKSVQLDGDATYNIDLGELDADLAGEARELGPFFRAAGLPIDGRAALDFKLAGLQGGTLDSLSLTAKMADLSSTDDDIAAALGEEAVLDVLLSNNGENVIQIERGLLESDVLRAEATGTISVPNDTVDLEVDFDLRDAAAVTALIEPAEIGAAQGKATLRGSLSEPQVAVNATASDFGFEDYSADSAEIDARVQYRKDRRAPFSLTAELDGVKTGDEDLDRVVGDDPVIEADGLYDTATGLLSLSKTEIDLADADVSLAGDIHLKKQTLDITYDLNAGDLSGFETLVGKPLAGSIDIAGSAKGPFTLPFVTAKGKARDLRYDIYSLDAADIDIETQSGEEGATPFRVDVTATNPKTGDPDLDALIGENPTLRAKGTLNREGPAIALDYLDADLATMKAKAEGSVDLGTRLLDLTFDVEAGKLDGLEGVLGKKVAGAITAKGTASGSFTAPEVKANVDGAGLRYDTYSVGSIKGDIDIEQSPSGFAPFDVNIEARDIKTGDADLDGLLAGASTVKATGEFNQSAQQIRIESAAVKAAGADLVVNGSVDIPGESVDLAFDIAAEDLSPFEAFVGVPLGGSVDAKGTAKGSLPTPEIDVTLSGKKLRYDTYSIGSIIGDIAVEQSPEGFAPFAIDVVARDVKTGDANLDGLLAGAATIKATGAFNQSAQKIRIESAAMKAAGADLALNGSIDIPGKAVDIAFDIAAEDLSPFEAFVGVPLGGSIDAKGTAKGSLPTPEIDVTLSGKKLRYDTYSVAAIDGKIDVQQAESGYAPFNIDVEATGIATGDEALDDLLDGPATIRAKGGFDQSKQRVRVDSATLRAAGTSASLSGDVDIASKTLDVAFDLEAADLSAFEPLAEVPLAGTVNARGTAAGGFATPKLNVKLAGKSLTYDTYKVGNIDGTIALDQPKDGYAPFDIDVNATGLSLGDPKLDEAVKGGVKIDAAGAFDQARQRLRLDRANLITDAATADLGGTVNLKAKTLDVRFDVDADDLAVFGPLVGADMGGAVAAKGTAKGPFSLPSVNATVDGKTLRYGTYRVASLDGTVSMESATKGFAPFDIDVKAQGIRTGDPKLDEVIGGSVTVDADGGFDRVKNIIRLDAATLDSGFATAKASGTVDLGAQKLDVAFDLDARRLAALEPLLDTGIAGSVALNGTAKGPFSLPAVDARLAARDIVYDRYSIARLDGRADMGTGKGSVLPFDVDLTASGIGTGDPALDATLGESVSVKARGAFDREANTLRLDTAALDAEFATANASGTVDLAAKTLDIAFDLDAERLAAFGPIANADIAGSLAMNGTARGAFVIPMVNATIDGQSVRYQQYSIARLTGDVDVGNAVNGALPFDIEVAASGIATGDAALDATIGETVRIDTTGTFDQDDQIVTLDSARFDAAFAQANAQGAIDLKAQTLDVAFDLTAADLAPVSTLVGAPVRGSVALRGTARGPFNLPAIDANLAGRDLGFDAYGARILDGAISLGLPQDGYAPFTVDMEGEGLSLGDPSLEAAFGARIDIDAAGAVDIAQQRIRLDRAALVTDSATVAASGSIDLTVKQLDIGFDVEAGNLSAFGPLAGADLGGTITMRGKATGPFVIPRVNADIAGTAIRYQSYTIGRISGSVGMDAAQNGVMPFTAALTAAGIGTGDPALDQALGGEVRVNAQGGFDQTAKRLTLAEATVNSAIGQVSAEGVVDLAAKSLDIGFNVDAGEVASLSGLVGTDIAGSLAAGGRVSGPFSAPSVATTLKGRSLRYAQYSIASLTGKASFAAVPEGFGPFDIDATAAGITTGDSSLDFALEGGVSIAGKGGFDLTNQRLRLDSLTAQARFATVAASGLVDLKAQMLDVNFTLDASDLSPLSGIVGKPMGGALRTSGSARGAFKAPIVNMQAQGGGLYYDGYSLAGLSLDLKMPSDAPGYLPFTLTGSLNQPRLNNPQIEYLLGETISINAEGVFDPTRQLLRLTDTRVTTANASVSAFGDVDLGNKLLDVKYYVDARDLSIAQPLAGKTLAGTARIRGRVSGALTDPTTSGRLTGQNIVYDTYRITTVAAFYDLQRLTSGPAGSVALNAETDLGPLTAKARFDLTGGMVRVEEVAVNGLGVGLNGSFRTGPNGVLEGSATLAASDLGQIGAFIGQDIAGRVDGTINLNGDQGKQNAFFDVTGMNFRYGPQASPTVLFTSFYAKGQAYDALGTNPYIDATASGIDGKLAGFPVTGIDVTAKGSFSALDTTVTARGGALGSDRIETVARLNLVNPPRSATVTRLALVYDGRQASIIEPLIAEEIVPGGFRIRNLDLRAEDGEVRGGVEYTQSGLVADLKIRNFPLALAALSGVDVIRSGRLDGSVDVDTRGGVRGTFALNASALRLNGAQIDDPFTVTANGTMDGTALNVMAELNGAELVQPLTASARIPLMSVAGSPLPIPNQSAPFSAQVDWQGDVGEIWAFVPLPDHILSGPVVINGRATGTLNAPMMSGGAVLTDGRYSNIEFGTLLTNLNAKADFTQDGRAVFDLSANDGVQGTVAASGSYVVASSTLDTRLSLNNAALVRRDDATAVLSGDATAVSVGRDISVKGDFRTDFVEVRLIGNFGGSLTVVDAIPVGKSAPLYIPPAVEDEASRKILLDVSLSIPNRAFVRGRGLDSEWGGQLDVKGTASNPRIRGEISKRRGVFSFLGKQFELAIGTVRFTGDTSPFVQVRLQREANDITGWIEVKGTVPDIGLEFGSTPALPEGEVLPRLLFGRSQQSLTALEAAQLAAGVATLLSGKAGVIDSVRDAVGVDVLRTESDIDGGTSIITGKYLRDEVFVGAKQNLQTGQTSGLVEIEVFDQFEIEAELGSEESKGSVGWQIEW